MLTTNLSSLKVIYSNIYNMVHIYSRSVLMSLSANLMTSRLLQSVWQELTGLGISRCRLTCRGCRAGRRKQRCISTVIGIRPPTLKTGRKFYHIADFVNNELNIHPNISSSELNIQVRTSVSGNLNNLILLELQWSIKQKIPSL